MNILLIDMSALIYRGIHGSNKRVRKSDGMEVGGVKGVFSRLGNLVIKFYGASHIIPIFDTKGGSAARKAIHPGYKGERPPKEETFAKQEKMVRPLMHYTGLRSLGLEGYEADDIIATYAKVAQGMMATAAIVTHDKDLLQVCDSNTYFYDVMTGSWATEDLSMKKFGVTPDKIVHCQALCGDAVDNIPGVEGIGAKSAANLIRMFGSYQAAFDNVDLIGDTRTRNRMKAEGSREQADLSYKLAELDTDIEGLPDISRFKFNGFNWKGLHKICDILEQEGLRLDVDQWKRKAEAFKNQG